MTTRPGPRLVAAAWVLAGLALIVPLVPAGRWVLLVALGAIAGAALAERHALGRVELSLRRPEAAALSLDEREVLSAVLETSSRRALTAVVRQRLPELLGEPALVVRGTLSAGRPLALDLAVRGVSRGAAALDPPVVALTAWGLAERVVPVGETTELSVIPNVRAVGRLARQLDRLALRGLGSRFSAQAGRGREFERLRDYVLGDELREVAWKASARHGKLIVKEHRIDRTQDVVVALDCGHRMAARVGDLTRLDHAVNATLLLAWMSNRIEDRLALVTFAGEVETTMAPGRGLAHQRRLVRALTDVRAEHSHSDHRALALGLKRQLEHRSLVVLFTDLPEGDDEIRALVDSVRLLMPKHLPFVALMSDPDLEAVAALPPQDRDELCRTLVAKDLVARRRHVVLELRRLGALVVTPRPGDAGTEAINGYLDVKRRQLL